MFDYFASSVAFGKVSLEEACARIAALGLKEIDLWFVGGMCEHLPPNQASLDTARIRRALSASGLRCHAMSVYGASQEVTLARLEQLAELGGTYLVRDSQTNGKERPQDVVDRLLPYLEKAKALNVVYAPENHCDTAFDALEQMRYVVNAAPSPHLAVAYAPIHSYKRKEDPAACIRALGKDLGLFYAWDWGPAAEKHWRDVTDQCPGTGKLNFAEMFAALRAIHYPRPLCLFAHGLEDIPAQQAEDAMRKSLAYCRGVEAGLPVAQAASVG
ncbi:MAG: sugar phosphate isomerase/epimerase [Planctomycetota bacterium]|nr:sugar phosphate isomerase/epimerase [Planctomycetota bacterium]